MLPNPWVLLGTVVMWASTLIGVWFYRGHVDAFQLQAVVQKIAADSSAAVVKSQQEAAAVVQAQATKVQEVAYALQSEQKKHVADVAAARDEHDRMLNAIAIYTNDSNLSASSELPVLKSRLATLGKLYGDMAASGEQSATDADADAANLRACEAWSKVVQPK